MPHVLVIDDAREIRDLFRIMLGRNGFTVSVAENATQGAEVARTKQPDVILLDLEMPDRDGVSCLEELRQHASTATIPVFVVSATPMREVIVRIAKLGVNGIILKNERVVIEILSRVRKLLKFTDTPRIGTKSAGPSASAVAAEIMCVDRGGASARSARPAGVPPGRRGSLLQGSSGAGSAVCTEEEDRESMSASVLQLNGEPMDIELASQELRSLKPLMSRAALLERALEGTDLRALKPAVQQVLHLTTSATASIENIANAIKQDQALSLKILKVANSPLYAHGDRVETIQKAVSRIGIAQIHSTVIGLAVIDQFGSVNLANRVKADWFWEHSITCGLIASKIAQMRRAKSDEVDSMFTAGLLHDIGRVIYAERLGDEYAGVIDVADRLEMPLETVESRLLLVNHADLTDRLLRDWNFSLELINPIALHHLSIGNIRRVAPRMTESVATLALANRLAHALLLGGSGNEVIYPTEEFVDFLALPRDQVLKVCQETPDQVLDLKLQMLASGGESGISLLDDARARLSAPVRPLHVSMETSIDAMSLLLDRLCPGGVTQTPNIAVVRVVDARERAPLLSKLRQAEADAGVKNLPALVVGSGTSCLFAAGSLGKRLVEQVILPLRLTRLIRSMNSLTDVATVAAAA